MTTPNEMADAEFRKKVLDFIALGEEVIVRNRCTEWDLPQENIS